MSTRCLIGRKIKDNKVEYIYCHHDGYLDGVGEILKTYYTNDSVIDKLMALGNLSALGEIAESNPNQFNFTGKIDYNLCAAYRDNGDEDVDSKIIPEKDYIDKLNTNIWMAYLYLWDGEKWHYYCENEWRAV